MSKMQVRTSSGSELLPSSSSPDHFLFSVKQLFYELTMNAFLTPETVEGWTWLLWLGEPKQLDFKKEYERIRVTCKFLFKPLAQDPYFEIELTAPKETKNYAYYSEEGYCKRLLGNGWSIPVVKHLLQGLGNICSETTTYEGYDYKFSWRS